MVLPAFFPFCISVFIYVYYCLFCYDRKMIKTEQMLSPRSHGSVSRADCAINPCLQCEGKTLQVLIFIHR